MIDRRDTLDMHAAASWGSIFAGAVTVLAMSIVLSLLGASLGLGSLDLQSDDVGDGLGLGFGVWSVVSLVLSLAAGGFVAGYLAGVTGWVHGFLAWATALIAAVALSAFAVSGTAQLAGSAIGSIGQLTGSAISSGASLGTDTITALADDIDGDMIGDIDLPELDGDIQTALNESDIEALQAESIEAELSRAREDVEAALEALRSDPREFDTIAEDLITDLTNRAEAFSEEVDRDEIVAAISDNTDLTEAEADEAADDVIAAYQTTIDEARAQIDGAETAIADARTEFERLSDEARERADAAAEAASSAAFWAFIAALVGAAVSAGAGLFGQRMRLLEEY